MSFDPRLEAGAVNGRWTTHRKVTRDCVRAERCRVDSVSP